MSLSSRSIPSSKFPLPIESTGLRMLSSRALPTQAILEIDTAANPIRIWLDKSQLKKIERLAGIAASKITDASL
jgi:hypothetical protein